MPTVGSIELKIARVEGFLVRIKYLNRTDVRSDREQMPPYPYERAAKDAWTVERWRRERFRRVYPGFEVDVLTSRQAAARGNMRLETVRDSYGQ
jgi:hypothetical protein